MLKPEDVRNKAVAPKPPTATMTVTAATAVPAPGPAPLPTTCALCGEPCHVVALVLEPGWAVQDCDCSGRRRRKLAGGDGQTPGQTVGHTAGQIVDK